MRGNGATRAAWIAAMAAVLSVPISLVSLGYTVWADRIRFREDLILNVSPVLDDYPTQLIETRGTSTGTVNTYWSILIANNSDRDVSLVEYDLREVHSGGDAVRYPSSNHGLFTTDLSDLDLPVNIPAGHAMRFYLKVGLVMDAEAFDIAKNFWQAGAVESFRGLIEHLVSKGFDIYGRLDKPETFRLIFKKGAGHGQIFLVSFRTARQTGLQATFSSTLVYLSPFPFR